MQASSRPLVSIIVPSYNQGQFIRRTLESILSQDYRPLEVIVIDGASTDETVSILQEFASAPELQWISEPDKGVVDAVNKGFARARGQVGGIQSSDDFYLPGAISAGVAALQLDPELGFVFGDITKVDAEGKELSRSSLAPYSLEGFLTLDPWIPQAATFFRMDLAKSLGGWRDLAPYAADTDLWLRMALQAPAKKIGRLMSQLSMHEAQRDTQGARIVRDYTVMIDSLMPQLSAMGLASAASVGKLLIANHYGKPSVLMRVGRMWRASIHQPKLFMKVPVSAYIPWYYHVRKRVRGLILAVDPRR